MYPAYRVAVVITALVTVTLARELFPISVGQLLANLTMFQAVLAVLGDGLHLPVHHDLAELVPGHHSWNSQCHRSLQMRSMPAVGGEGQPEPLGRDLLGGRAAQGRDGQGAVEPVRPRNRLAEPRSSAPPAFP
ncbi:hypothetical protein [Microbispora sp. GKU 823]|uniref:hypothetical protein n=1 Tax=Microbispora sp. GKU 823 TaxID=1652100 RepID=UPI0009CB312D|nr:hypothetical protein [Microbispora sp. GKU 823]OPG12218.1 hypothetical protein B1L11_15310 [Microbispora sp. GKU 823]